MVAVVVGEVGVGSPVLSADMDSMRQRTGTR